MGSTKQPWTGSPTRPPLRCAKRGTQHWQVRSYAGHSETHPLDYHSTPMMGYQAIACDPENAQGVRCRRASACSAMLRPTSAHLCNMCALLPTNPPWKAHLCLHLWSPDIGVFLHYTCGHRSHCTDAFRGHQDGHIPRTPDHAPWTPDPHIQQQSTHSMVGFRLFHSGYCAFGWLLRLPLHVRWSTRADRYMLVDTCAGRCAGRHTVCTHARQLLCLTSVLWTSCSGPFAKCGSWVCFMYANGLAVLM